MFCRLDIRLRQRIGGLQESGWRTCVCAASNFDRHQFSFVNPSQYGYIPHCDTSDFENKNGRKDMIRSVAVILLFTLVGCGDKSRGAAFNECRMKTYLGDPATHSEVMSECMKARSFQIVLPCSSEPDDYEWDWQAQTSANDPKCYRATGAPARAATTLSPM